MREYDNRRKDKHDHNVARVATSIGFSILSLAAFSQSNNFVGILTACIVVAVANFRYDS